MSELDDALSALLGSPEEHAENSRACVHSCPYPSVRGNKLPRRGAPRRPRKAISRGSNIAQMMKLFSAAIDDKSAALLKALKPFLSPERAEKVDRAMNAARLARIAQAALMKEKD